MARWDASVQHLGLAEVCVEIEGRLFLCAGCRVQVVVGADLNLTHPADLNLTRGWVPAV